MFWNDVVTGIDPIYPWVTVESTRFQRIDGEILAPLSMCSHGRLKDSRCISGTPFTTLRASNPLSAFHSLQHTTVSNLLPMPFDFENHFSKLCIFDDHVEDQIPQDLDCPAVIDLFGSNDLEHTDSEVL